MRWPHHHLPIKIKRILSNFCFKFEIKESRRIYATEKLTSFTFFIKSDKNQPKVAMASPAHLSTTKQNRKLFQVVCALILVLIKTNLKKNNIESKLTRQVFRICHIHPILRVHLSHVPCIRCGIFPVLCAFGSTLRKGHRCISTIDDRFDLYPLLVQRIQPLKIEKEI